MADDLALGFSSRRPSPVQVGCSLVSADGGRLEPVPAPDDKGWVAQSWSPDGGTIVLWRHGDPVPL